MRLGLTVRLEFGLIFLLRLTMGLRLTAMLGRVESEARD